MISNFIKEFYSVFNNSFYEYFYPIIKLKKIISDVAKIPTLLKLNVNKLESIQNNIKDIEKKLLIIESSIDNLFDNYNNIVSPALKYNLNIHKQQSNAEISKMADKNIEFQNLYKFLYPTKTDLSKENINSTTYIIKVGKVIAKGRIKDDKQFLINLNKYISAKNLPSSISHLIAQSLFYYNIGNFDLAKNIFNKAIEISHELGITIHRK